MTSELPSASNRLIRPVERVNRLLVVLKLPTPSMTSMFRRLAERPGIVVPTRRAARLALRGLMHVHGVPAVRESANLERDIHQLDPL